MTKKIHLIVGYGQIGKAIEKILKDKHNVSHLDKGEKLNFDKKQKIVMHIAFTYDKNFLLSAKKYIKQYKPELIIIHSTVDIGTTKKLGNKAVHSPCRGVHPNLEKGIRTFVKYFGSSNKKNAKKAAKIFSDLGIKTRICNSAEETEAGKLLDTTYYGWNIVFMHYMKDYCKKHKLDFDIVYSEFNETYNSGYNKLGMKNVIRPVLKYMKGKIGGHCVVPNCVILKDFRPAQIILEKNKKL